MPSENSGGKLTPTRRSLLKLAGAVGIVGISSTSAAEQTDKPGTNNAGGKSFDPIEATVEDIQTAIRNEQVTALSITEQYLNRIEIYDASTEYSGIVALKMLNILENFEVTDDPTDLKRLLDNHVGRRLVCIVSLLNATPERPSVSSVMIPAVESVISSNSSRAVPAASSIWLTVRCDRVVRIISSPTPVTLTSPASVQ